MISTHDNGTVCKIGDRVTMVIGTSSQWPVDVVDFNGEKWFLCDGRLINPRTVDSVYVDAA